MGVTTQGLGLARGTSMTNDPYRDDPYGLGGSRSTGGGTSEPPPPDAAWRPPNDPTAADPPPAGSPPPAGGDPGANPTGPYQSPPPEPSAYSSPQYEAQQYQGQPYPGPYQGQQYQGQQYQGQPYPGPYQGQPYPGPYQGQPYPGAPRRTNGLAVAALVCSLAGVITVISAPVGAVLGHLAARQIAQTGEEGGQLAKGAIWAGWIITGLYLAACCALLALAITASRTSPAFGPR